MRFSRQFNHEMAKHKAIGAPPLKSASLRIQLLCVYGMKKWGVWGRGQGKGKWSSWWTTCVSPNMGCMFRRRQHYLLWAWSFGSLMLKVTNWTLYSRFSLVLVNREECNSIDFLPLVHCYQSFWWWVKWAHLSITLSPLLFGDRECDFWSPGCRKC